MPRGKRKVLKAGAAASHPIRMRIVAHLATVDRASPTELCEINDEKLGVIAYHVRVLEQAYVIELAGETRVRGAVAHHYRLRPEARDPALAAVKAALDRAQDAMLALST